MNQNEKSIKLEIAKNMLKESIEKISELTGLSVEEISLIDIKSQSVNNKQKNIKETGKKIKEIYTFEYTSENEFRKYERSLKFYNMLAYKKLYFSIYPSLKEGNFLGNLINKKNNIKKYELELPTDISFSKVYGTMTLHYTVNEDNHTVNLDKIGPEAILGEDHKSELTTYKGVMVSKQNEEKDIFKINLLNMLQK